MYVTMTIIDNQHNNALNIAECHILFVAMLSVIMLIVVAPVCHFRLQDIQNNDNQNNDTLHINKNVAILIVVKNALLTAAF